MTASSRITREGAHTQLGSYCHSANGRCCLSSLLLKSSSWWEGGLCSLRLLAPQILKSALPGGGPKGSKYFIIIFLNTITASGLIVLKKRNDWIQRPQPQTHWQNYIWSRMCRPGLLYP